MANRIEKIQQIRIPDMGGAEHVTVVEILVKIGDIVKKEQSLLTLEGEKATMDVPSPVDGKVKDILVKVGDTVKEGTAIISVLIAGEGETESKTEKIEKSEKSEKSEKKETEKKETEKTEKTEQPEKIDMTEIHAGPAVRRLAYEVGVSLTKIKGTGPKARILKEDLKQYIQTQLRIAENKSIGGGFPPLPAIDFSKFGEIETQSLSKIKKISGANLARNWVTIPHVTQFGWADITLLETFRQNKKEWAASQGVRLTPIVFIMKAVVAALKQFPHFNASLDTNGENLIVKKYFHLGVAVDTPNGLVVPVIRHVDCKGLFELAKELAAIGEKARTKGLSPADMQGGCFTISSLGGIGGTAFTPIINAPEVAILGISRMEWKSVWQNQHECQTRLMLPLSLSYDHRVIDGAEGARFITYLIERLAEIETLLL